MASIRIEINRNDKSDRKSDETKIKKLVGELLRKAGFIGDFEVALGKARKAGRHTKKVQIKKDKVSYITAFIKPGNNGSCREMRIYVPSGFAGNSQAFFESLRAAAEVII